MVIGSPGEVFPNTACILDSRVLQLYGTLVDLIKPKYGDGISWIGMLLMRLRIFSGTITFAIQGPQASLNKMTWRIGTMHTRLVEEP